MSECDLSAAAATMAERIRNISDDELTGAQAPSGDASRLTDEWRRRIPADLANLAAAWTQPEAWTGMARAGGVDLAGEIAGVVALDELVIHG
jgi:Mycothiol maleylpyruvate isomerase N-terminal domain